MLVYILGNFFSKAGGRGGGPPQPQGSSVLATNRAFGMYVFKQQFSDFLEIYVGKKVYKNMCNII